MNLFLSPHLDDAILSCAGLMTTLAEAKQQVVAPTLFTADHDASCRLSAYAQHLHASWGSATPYRQRREEDRQALEAVGARPIHLGLKDAIYRTGPAATDFYADSHAVFSGRIPEWETIDREIEASVVRLVRELQPRALYIPLGVGRHVDHIVTREAVVRLRSRMPAIYLYEDMPYAAGAYPPHAPDSVTAALERLQAIATRPMIVPINFEAKMEAINAYRSQIEELRAGADFDATIRAYCSSVGDGIPAERYWQII